MITFNPPEILVTDVLVIGGGLAGCWAALKARQRGMNCILIDKGHVGQTGCSRFASGDFKGMMPQSDFNACMEQIVIAGGYLGHQEWIEVMLLESLDRALELESMGIRFEKGDDGRIRHTDETLPELTIGSSELMPRFRKVLQKAGVQIVDRIFIHQLLLDQEGTAAGALGLSTREAKTLAVLSKASIIASGSCSLRASYFGHHFSTGDAYSLALDAGASLVSMEAVNHNISFTEFDSTGGRFFRLNGATFINRHGEAFLHRYKGIPTGHAMAIEVKRTGGPIYMDIKGMKKAEIEKAGAVMPWLKLMLERSENQTQRYECVAAFAGSRATAAGISITKDGASTVKGLFATGDAGAMLGNGMAAMGINLTNCSVFGSRCGNAAADYCREADTPSADEVGPLSVEMGRSGSEDLTSEKVLHLIQQAILPMDISIIRHESRLRSALGRIEEIREEMLPRVAWHDPHTLIKKLETGNMVTYCEAMLEGALLRTESRGVHYREDFPKRDDAHWLKLIGIKGIPGKLDLSTMPLPPGAFKYIKPTGKGQDIYERIRSCY